MYVRSKFSIVRASHDLCARAQLRGNIGHYLSACAEGGDTNINLTVRYNKWKLALASKSKRSRDK